MKMPMAADSAIKLTPEQEQHLSTLSGPGLLEYLHECAVEQGLYSRLGPRDNNELVLAEPQTPTPQRFAVTIRDDKGTLLTTLEADSQEALVQAQINFWKQQGSQPANGQSRSQLSPEDQAAAAANADLQSRVISGQISAQEAAQEYLATPAGSKALDSYLESRGIAVQSQEQREAAQWSAAANEFIKRHPDWEGGEDNQASIMEALDKLGLAEKTPSAESLEKAFEYIQQNEMYFENPNTTLNREIGQATTAEEIHRLCRPDFDSLFATRGWHVNG